ncbi:Ubiquitin fusion degradation protein 1 [Hanseniaspora osmophila]|uniref:Ubiquitin fusion degradation protein 1 n=1 Tax=Hanseniaspora osmophila TaxID=56408 RepID=A0A1E5RGK9_9ASCO|nr:Ubiquitin fusion degradation protein 1 [Hanseniaspora osmophila]
MFSGFGLSNAAGGFVNIPQQYQDYFRCYPIDMMNGSKSSANNSGKIFLPPSALNKLIMLNIRYPMLFELKSPDSSKITHAGVWEFVAEEGRVYLPNWMMSVLKAKPGSLLHVSSTDVPLGKFVKLEPQSVDFLEITNPKAVLENALRNFSTLTVEDIIDIEYNGSVYKIRVVEVKPENKANSICVIETDLETDFAPPVGYVEPDYKKLQEEELERKKNAKPKAPDIGSMARRINYVETLHAPSLDSSFSGSGQKLSGKEVSNNAATATQKILPEKLKEQLQGTPQPLNLPDGQLFFGFPYVPPENAEENSAAEPAHTATFTGEGQSLRKSSKRKVKKDHSTSKSKAPKSPEVIEID